MKKYLVIAILAAMLGIALVSCSPSSPESSTLTSQPAPSSETVAASEPAPVETLAAQELGVQTIGGFEVKVYQNGDLPNPENQASFLIEVAGETMPSTIRACIIPTAEGQGEKQMAALDAPGKFSIVLSGLPPSLDGAQLLLEIEGSNGELNSGSYDLKLTTDAVGAEEGTSENQ